MGESSTKPAGKISVLTGVKPTGNPHIGNYLGAIRPAIELSREPNTETWFFVADYHALINVHDPKEMRANLVELAAVWLASGLDPSSTVFFKQSDVPEVLELNWVLSCFTPKGLMNRAHAYKAKVQENEAQGKEDLDFGVNMGLYNYPILMAADILMFSADRVPVGDDQVQHIEITRDIAQKFNRQYGNILKVPNYILQKVGKSVPGLDGRKMSKSYDNYIAMFEEPAKMKKLVARIKSDSLPPEAPKSVEGSILFEIYEGFASPSQVEEMRAKFTKGISWGAVKEELFQVMDAHLAPKREKYKQLMGDQAYIADLLKKGADRARAKAVPLMEKIRKEIGIRG
jgi:tryptophanyl-tRNA synthetase